MSFLLWTIGAAFALTVTAVVSYIRWNRGRYKYKAFIIAQVGEGHAIVEDKFRVYKTEDGFYALEFWSQRDLAMTSPPYKFWTFFSKDEKAAETVVAEGNKWTAKELDHIFTRGCIFKKTSEGDVHPAMITQEADLKVLSQDDRAYSIQEAKTRAERRETAWDKYAPYVVAGGTVFLSLMVLVFFVIYFNMTMADNVAAVCSGVAEQATASPIEFPGVGA